MTLVYKLVYLNLNLLAQITILMSSTNIMIYLKFYIRALGLFLILIGVSGCVESRLASSIISPHKEERTNSDTIKGDYQNKERLKEACDDFLIEKFPSYDW